MKIVRDTPFEIGWTVWQIRPPVPSLTVVVKATFKLVHGDVCTIADTQVPVTGDLHHDDEPARSVRYESDLAVHKPRGEVYLAGTCHVPSKVPLRVSAVAVEVSSPGATTPTIRKALAVYGDRHWVHGVVTTASQAEPFMSMPLCWERSFGGPTLETNPVGKGVPEHGGAHGTVRPLPNLENPEHPIVAPDDRPMPAGLFPIPRTWRARTRLTGTATPSYVQARWPWYPEDFDFAYFNCAPADQQIEGFWRGDETLKLLHLVEGKPQIDARLPSLKPRVFLDLVPRGSQSIGGRKASRFEEVALRLDTLAIDSDAGVVTCLWRGVNEIGSMELEDVAHLYAAHEPLAARTEPHHWRARFLAALGAEAAAAKPASVGPPPMPPAGMPAAPAIPGAPGLPAIPGAPAPPPAPPEAPAPPSPDAPPGAAAAPAAAARAPSVRPPASAGPSADRPPRPVVAREVSARLRDEVIAKLEKNEPLAGLDLTGADLSGLHLRDVDLGKAILAGADLRGVRLDHAKLEGATLAHADLEAATLAGARLRGADLAYVRAKSAAFDDAVLDEADLTGAYLELASFFTASCLGTLFVDANLTSAIFDEARLDKAELDGARMADASIQRAFLVDTTLQGCVLTRARFDGSDLTKVRASDGASFVDASLVRVKAAGGRFARSDLSRADLSHSELDKADFDRANLDAIRLDGCTLRRARFQHAKLTGASLLKANLHEANLKAADLSRADLRGANFFAAQLYRARMDGARMELTNFERTLLAGVVR